MSIAELEQTALRYMEFEHFALDKPLAEVQCILRQRFPTDSAADWKWHAGCLDYRITCSTVQVQPFSAIQHCMCNVLCSNVYIHVYIR